MIRKNRRKWVVTARKKEQKIKKKKSSKTLFSLFFLSFFFTFLVRSKFSHRQGQGGRGREGDAVTKGRLPVKMGGGWAWLMGKRSSGCGLGGSFKTALT